VNRVMDNGPDFISHFARAKSRTILTSCRGYPLPVFPAVLDYSRVFVALL